MSVNEREQVTQELVKVSKGRKRKRKPISGDFPENRTHDENDFQPRSHAGRRNPLRS